jgi:DNA-binding transcriptional ArsR family regulator
MDFLTYADMSYKKKGESPMERGNGGAGSAARTLLGWEALDEASQCLKSVAHPVRLRVLELLLEGEYSVGELAELCEVDQPAISGHLGQLRDRGILTQERQGRNVYYRVAAATAIEGIVTCMRKNFGPSRSGTGCRG